MAHFFPDRKARLAAGASALVLLAANGASAQPVPVPDVSVTGAAGTPDQQLQQDGSAADGYVNHLLSANGPLPQQSLLDTPYPANITSRALIENLQLYSPTDLAKISPFLQEYVPEYETDSANFTLRGFGTASFGGGSPVAQTLDGFRAPGGFNQDLDDKERVEVLTGVTSFVNGENAPGGTINYVQKRPTAAPLAALTAGDAGGGMAFIHGDFGGPLMGNSNIGYRLNVVLQDGPTAVDHQDVNREQISAAVDFHLAPNLLLETDASYRHNGVHSLDAGFAYSGAGRYPGTPDASKNWGQPWTFDETWGYQGDVKLIWDINSAITSRSGVLGSYRKSNFLGAPPNLNPDGSYSQSVFLSDNFQQPTYSAYNYKDFRFDVLGTHHTLTVGVNGYTQNVNLPRYWWDQELTPFISNAGNIFTAPNYVPRPDLVPAGSDLSLGLRTHLVNYNEVLGDTIGFGDQFSIVAGVNHSTIIDDVYIPNEAGNRQTANYDDDAWTPAVSLLYKPASWITTYMSYLQGLDQGAAAPNNASYTNRGAVLAPTISTDYELGTKIDWNRLFFTFNLFDVRRSYDYGRDNGDGTFTFVQDGIDDHKGLEFAVTGKLTDDLTLVAGWTLLDPKVKHSTQGLDGARPWDTADQVIKLYGEYNLDAFIPGLTLTGGVRTASGLYADAANTQYVPGWTVGDIGFRYEMATHDMPLVFRFNVYNVTDKNYWATSAYLGDPRTFVFSVGTTL